MRTKNLTPTRAYFALGVLGGRLPSNIAGLWRTAFDFGASFVFSVDAALPKTASEEITARKYGPVFGYQSVEDFLTHRPGDCQLVLVARDAQPEARPWSRFTHPDRAIYLLVNEDVPETLRQAASHELSLPGALSNLTVAGSIILSHRDAQFALSENTGSGGGLNGHGHRQLAKAHGGGIAMNA
jgi:hypothetical protein